MLALISHVEILEVCACVDMTGVVCGSARLENTFGIARVPGRARFCPKCTALASERCSAEKREDRSGSLFLEVRLTTGGRGLEVHIQG